MHRAVGLHDPHRRDVLRLAHGLLGHDDARPHGAHAGLHAGELSGLQRLVGIGEHHHHDERPGGRRDILARVVVDSSERVSRAVGQHETDVRQQPFVVVDRSPVARIAQVLRHRNRHVDRQRVDVRHGRQHAELRAGTHVVAHVRRRVLDDAVDGRAQLGVSHVHAGVAQRLLRRAHRGLGGLPLGRVLVQLRLADGVDARQRHGAVVVVAGFEGLCAGRFEFGFGRQHRGRQLVGVDGEQQLAAPYGHAVAVLFRREVAVHARLDHGVEVAREVTDETHAVGHAVDGGLGHPDPQGRHRLFRRMFRASREECGEKACGGENFVHKGMFYPAGKAKNVPSTP